MRKNNFSQTICWLENIFWLHILFLVLPMSVAAKVSGLEEEVQNIAEKLIQIEGIDATFTLSNVANHSSLSNGQIQLSEPHLTTLRSTYNRDEFDALLIIIMAHEYGHQIEYSLDRNSMVQTNSCEKRTYYEAQADIIAGYLFAVAYKYYEYSKLTNSSGFANLALRFMYNLGDREYSIGTHPSFKQRRNAFRMGMAYAIYSHTESNAVKDLISAEYNVPSNLSLYEWSSDMSKAICHFPNECLLNIKHEDVNELQWNKTRDNPTVRFSERYSNLGTKTVHLFLQYKVIGENRTDNDPSYADIHGDSKFFEFDLEPGDSKVCSGTLNWSNVATTSYMPLFISPPDNEAIYYGDDHNDPNLDEDCTQDMNYSLLDDKIIVDYGSAIQKLNRESLTKFKRLQLGFISEITDDFTDHQSRFVFPNSTENTVTRYNDDGSMSYDIDFDGSEEQINKIYVGLKTALQNLTGYSFAFRDDYSTYVDEDGNDTGFDHNHKASLNNGIELIRKNEREELNEMEGLFSDTQCTVSIRLTKNIRYHRYSLNLNFKAL